MSSEIPDFEQGIIRAVETECEQLLRTIREGGPWLHIYTWAVRLKRGVDIIAAIGEAGVTPAARMPIDPERIDQIVRDFTVPDSLEGGA